MNVQPPSGSKIAFTPSSPYFTSWTGVVIGGRLWLRGEAPYKWSDTAQGFVCPWLPEILCWVELHQDGTYAIVDGGPPRTDVQTGTWQYV